MVKMVGKYDFELDSNQLQLSTVLSGIIVIIKAERN